MSTSGVSQPSARRLGPLSRRLDDYFRDPSTGRVVLYQKPNATLTMVGLLIGASRVLHAVDAGTPFDIFLERAATAMLLWWSVDEMVRGTTTYRKTIGGVTLAAAVLRTVVAEGSRARSPA
jgi:hypothetical protein